MRHLPLTLVLVGVAMAQAMGATLRPMTTLSSSLVRLSDLFDDAGPAGARVLGPAPAPGGRIVVEAAQLGAIARQFGVDWTAASSGDRAVLDRPGRIMPRDEALAAIRTALESAGASPGCEIELPGFVPPLVPPESTASPVATQMSYDADSGRFTAVLSVIGEGMDPINMRVSGRVQETIEVPVAARRLPAGGIVAAADIRMGRVRVASVRAEIANEPAQAIGLLLRHAVMPGQPLQLADLQRPPLVRKGAGVLIDLDSPGLTLTAEGQALSDGASGDTIRVLNPASHAVMEATVTDVNRVRIQPDAYPIVPAARDKQQVAAE